MPLEGDWQRAELARSVTLPMLRSLTSVAAAAAEPEPLARGTSMTMTKPQAT